MSAGIGLKVERSAAGYVVTALSERGGAKRSGVLEIGDLVASIDGVDVTASACALAPLVLGPEGSQLRLGYTRKPGGPTRFVMLTRGQEEERLAVRATQSPLAFHTDQPAHMNAEKQRASRPSTGGAGGHGGRGERSPGPGAVGVSVDTEASTLLEPLRPTSVPPPGHFPNLGESGISAWGTTPKNLGTFPDERPPTLTERPNRRFSDLRLPCRRPRSGVTDF
ncbi:hypothetical protein T484DRAFT_3118773 [Baffinella frigidus]|nr:hypothetical protein T484DRAFT_3118773 [Cryptophyta sp. CCMP2293]